MSAPFQVKTYYAVALDPIHVGTGGYRLGRVDNTITREPGTNLPKIPGSSIAGAARAYTAMAVQNEFQHLPLITKKQKYQRVRLDQTGKEVVRLNKDRNEMKDLSGQPLYEFDSCAGKGANDGDGHCGMPDCEVCVTYGFSRKSGNSFQGLVQFCDARILFFPVHSMIGPVWVTSPSILREFQKAISHQEAKFSADIQLSDGVSVQTDLVEANQPLNLGWLLLKTMSSKIKPVTTALSKLDQYITDHVVIVPDKLLPRIVNDNLEVRTSVAIDPATGAAEDGALFTYEAIPRASVLWFDIICSPPAYFRVNGNEEIALEKPRDYLNPLKNPAVDDAEQMGFIAFNVERGLKYFQALGIGGMNTRGMGRMDVLNLGG
jgi:CRISPR-associated protein Cmr4